MFCINFCIKKSRFIIVTFLVEKFFHLKSNKDKSAFLYAKVDTKDKNSNKIEYLSDFKDLYFLIRNILKISNEESLEIISQSIPEKNPILYTEKSFKILQ